VRANEGVGEKLITKIVGDPANFAAGGHGIDPRFEHIAQFMRLVRMAEDNIGDAIARRRIGPCSQHAHHLGWTDRRITRSPSQ
jgi:hypothetical protein